MKISMIDYLNWDRKMPQGLRHEYSSVDGIIFHWRDNFGGAQNLNVNTIDQAEMFVRRFEVI